MAHITRTKRCTTYRGARDAFSLMEILLAVFIMGILASLVGPGIVKRMRQVSVNSTKTTMENIKSAVLEYKTETKAWPTTLDDLVEQPRNVKDWDGPYLSGKNEVPQDAWGSDFVYNRGKDIVHKDKFKYFEILSYGSEGEQGGEFAYSTGE